MGDTNEASTEGHRFYIALVILIGMILIIAIPVLYEQYDSAKDLAAIFSGWMTSVVGFYFLQQNTEKAQQQTKIATEEASQARREATDAARKTASLVGTTELTIAEYKKRFEEAKSAVLKFKTLYEEALDVNKKLLEMVRG